MRDNASNNNAFVDEFTRLNTDFQYDIRYTAHILNIVAGDLFKGFYLRLKSIKIFYDILIAE